MGSPVRPRTDDAVAGVAGASVADVAVGDDTVDGGRNVAVARPALDERLVRRVADRLDAWRQDARVIVAVILVCCAVTGIVWYRRAVAASGSSGAAAASESAAAEPASPGVEGAREPDAAASEVASAVDLDMDADATDDTTDAAPTAATTDVDATSDPILVHVAGAVTEPGVVEIEAGARVIDAIDAAGGALDGADLDRLNLAALVGDGQRIVVALVGDDPTPAEPEGGVTGDDAPAASDNPIDLNTASASELETLPGIGPTLAAAIIEERTERGGFSEVGQLLSVPGIGEQRLATLTDLVTL